MNLENLEKSRVKATFDVKADEFEKALDKAFEKVNKTVSVKGFRKGHTPRSVFEKTYGVEALFEEAINEILNAKVQEVYANQELASKVCGQFEPEISKDFGRGKDFTVSLTFDVFPQPKLPEYKGVEVKKQVLEATEEQVLAEVNNTLKAYAKVEKKAEQVIALHDTAVFDFVGKVDGKEFEGGSATNYELEIGSGQFIPGFEDQMVGMKAEETKDINVTFPTEYPAADLAGKAAVFTVTVHEVKENVLPELNDEFVKTLNIKDVNTVEELKANKKASIEASLKVSEKNRQIDEIFTKIVEGTEVEVPASLVEEAKTRFVSQYEQQAKAYNLPLETLLSLMGTTKEKFDEDVAKRSQEQAKFQVVLSALIEAENATPSKEEVDAKAEELAKSYNQTKEQVLGQRLSQIYNQLAYDKIVEILLANAKEI